MDFVLTARDERGGVSSDAMQIEVIAPPIVGPSFGLTEPNGGQVLGSAATGAMERWRHQHQSHFDKRDRDVFIKRWR
jgi:hypothetical protein